MFDAILSVLGIVTAIALTISLSACALGGAAWVCCALYKSAKEERFI